MNNGVPVLSTKLPEYDAVIEEGENGFFCSSSLEFKEKIIEFHRLDENEYNTFSLNTRNTIKHFKPRKSTYPEL